ncbi:glycosyltransferase [Bacillus sp. 2205SS5-2]|uniref:glycosyltransferase n=1 Tax=Bacillus sp. 2205SS5-2 TaxID=3109031 RepID=UPI003004B08A
MKVIVSSVTTDCNNIIIAPIRYRFRPIIRNSLQKPSLINGYKRAQRNNKKNRKQPYQKKEVKCMLSGILFIVIHKLLFWRIPTFDLSAKEGTQNQTKKISIIIPARNEEDNLKSLLTSLKKQAFRPKEIIVVNDDSTDRTKEVALALGATVIDAPPLPPNWMGKSWACWIGAQKTKGEWLLFLDADTTFEKNGLCKIASLFSSKKSVVFSIHPFHMMKSSIERLSSFFHLVIFAATGHTHPFSNTQAFGGFGQCLLCEKDSYFQLGGHKSISGEIVENLALLNAFKQQGKIIEAYSGKDVLNMRMYSASLPSVFFGWAKSFATGAKNIQPILLIIILIWIGSLYTFVSNLLSDPITESVWLLYAWITLVLFRTLRKIGHFSLLSTFLFPVNLGFFLVTFFYSLVTTYLLKRSMWKGRNVVISDKGEKMK